MLKISNIIILILNIVLLVILAITSVALIKTLYLPLLVVGIFGIVISISYLIFITKGLFDLIEYFKNENITNLKSLNILSYPLLLASVYSLVISIKDKTTFILIIINISLIVITITNLILIKLRQESLK